MPIKFAEALDEAIASAAKAPSPFLKQHVFPANSPIPAMIQSIEISGSSSFRMVDADVFVLMDALAKAQGGDVFLIQLSLKNHNLTDVGLSHICAKTSLNGGGGQSSIKLQILDLEGNDIEGKNVADLHLESGDCTLESLNLSYNPLAVGTGMSIANAVRTNRSLHTLTLNSCSFPLNTVIALATTLRQNTSLRALSLDRPLITTRQEEGTDHLGRLLGGSASRLAHLSLRYHGIADFGARLLATSLASHASLTHLDLERNKIGVQGCEAIASHMILQPTGGAVLRTLLLSYNEVGDEGAIALAEVIRANRPLSRLTLKNNGINEAGLVKIGQALVHNANLQHLALFGNHFSHHTGEVFVDSLGQGGGAGAGVVPRQLSMDFRIYCVDETYLAAECDE